MGENRFGPPARDGQNGTYPPKWTLTPRGKRKIDLQEEERSELLFVGFFGEASPFSIFSGQRCEILFLPGMQTRKLVSENDPLRHDPLFRSQEDVYECEVNDVI